MDDVVVCQADAAGGNGIADGPGLVGAMDTVDGRADVEGAGAKRIVRATLHVSGQDPAVTAFTGNHFRRRGPARPLGLAGDVVHAGPFEAFAADADAVFHRTATFENVIKTAFLGVDDDGAGLFRTVVTDLFPADRRILADARSIGLPLFGDRIIELADLGCGRCRHAACQAENKAEHGQNHLAH